MNELKIQLSDESMARLEAEANRLGQPLHTLIQQVILDYLAEEATDEAILSGLRRGMQQALSGNYRPAHEVLDELDQEMGDNANDS